MNRPEHQLYQCRRDAIDVRSSDVPRCAGLVHFQHRRTVAENACAQRLEFSKEDKEQFKIGKDKLKEGE